MSVSTVSDVCLSVVIIGRNEGTRLVRCLKSVWAMSHPFGSFEVIYVDSCSTDDSVRSAAALGATVVELKVGKMCAARARNAGWQIAKAPFVLFLDGDTVLHPDFVVKALARFDDPNMMVVYGRRREIDTEASVYNRVMDLEWIIPPGPKDSCGGDALFRRSALEQTGGYNPELIAGEEPELCRRIRATGGLIYHTDDSMTAHDLAIVSWRQYWRRAVRTGHAYAEVSSLYKNTDFPIWRKESRRNIMNGSLYLGGFAAAVAASAILHSWLFLGAFFACVAIRMGMTAYKFRWKTTSPGLCLLFGVHSHLQQLPIFTGQIIYWIQNKRNATVELIEYKTTDTAKTRSID
jgi:cellulose synthase/poly-beta-1,6-N-acetylglucosamine synthase-like glycosyltransferase